MTTTTPAPPAGANTRSPGPAPYTLDPLTRPRRARAIKDVLARIAMWGSFGLAMIPLVWILWTAASRGFHMLTTSVWWTGNQRNINTTDAVGGARHAIEGTLIQAGMTAAIAVPLAVLTAIYLVEYGRG